MTARPAALSGGRLTDAIKHKHRSTKMYTITATNPRPSLDFGHLGVYDLDLAGFGFPADVSVTSDKGTGIVRVIEGGTDYYASGKLAAHLEAMDEGEREAVVEAIEVAVRVVTGDCGEHLRAGPTTWEHGWYSHTATDAGGPWYQQDDSEGMRRAVSFFGGTDTEPPTIQGTKGYHWEYVGKFDADGQRYRSSPEGEFYPAPGAGRS